MNVKKNSYKELRPSDRRIYDELERFTDDVLNEEKLDVYLDNLELTLGKNMRKIFSDILTPFLNYLKDQSEFFKVDMISDCIDGYEDEEKLSNDKKENKKR